MEEVMNIALSSSRKMFLPAYVTLTSMFENHRERCVHAYILHSELEPQQMESFRKLAEKYGGKAVQCNVQEESLCEIRADGRFGLETFYRLFISKYLPDDIERVLVVGTDVIINRNIEEYYYQDFDGKCLVACEDIMCKRSVRQPDWYVANFLREDGYGYFNSDVLLYDMHELRKMHLPGKFVEAWEEFHELMTFLDQDVLNYLLYDKVKYADEYVYNFHAKGFFSEEWNYDRVTRETKIIHYSGPMKPWQMQAFHCELDYIWWKYAQKTDFYGEIADGFIQSVILGSDVREYISDLRNKLSKSVEEVWEMRQQYFDMRREVRRLEKELESRG